MIIIKYEIVLKDLMGYQYIDERTFKTDDLTLAVQIAENLKASDDVKYIEIKSV